MAYREIDFTKVKGFNNLSNEAKELFIRTYKLHNTIQGTDYKEDYEPIKVKEEKTHLKVTFKNGVWLHYYPNGTWG